jgi:hypothetical protein
MSIKYIRTYKMLPFLILLMLNSCEKENISEVDNGPTLTVSSTSILFKDIGFGLSCDTTIKVKNSGNQDISISNISFSGQNSSEFAISNISFPISLSPEDSIPIIIKFNPVSEGNKISNLVISSNAKNSKTQVSLSGTALGKIWSVTTFKIQIHAQHLETIEDSSRFIYDYIFYSNSELDSREWYTPYKFKMYGVDNSHTGGYNFEFTAEISPDRMSLLKLVCKYWRRNGVTYGSNAITSDFELNNIPVLSDRSQYSYTTIGFLIKGEDAKNHLKINQYTITGFIPYKVLEVTWKYVSTVWDKDSYILVTF